MRGTPTFATLTCCVGFGRKGQYRPPASASAGHGAALRRPAMPPGWGAIER